MLEPIRAAIRHLNPNDVRRLAARRFSVGLLASDDEAFAELVRFLLPAGISDRKAQQSGRHVFRVEDQADLERCEFGIVEPGQDRPDNFYPPDQAVDLFLERHQELWIPVARHFPAFRDPVVERLIRKIARENALFVVATALPNVVPSLLELPWAIGEFATDTAFLTMNQIRLAFLIAAASDAPVGYIEQRGQIASIITSAFGWRALARELISKVPFGGGLLPKGAVAFAGTYVVGLGLERYQRFGRGLTAQEKREQYVTAYQRGRGVVEQILARWNASQRQA